MFAVQEGRTNVFGRAWVGNGSQGGQGRGLTITVSFIRAILAVGLTIAAQTQVHTLASGAGELGGRAHWTAFFIALVGTLGEAITAPGSRDTVNLTSGTRKLIRGAGRRLWGREGDHSHTGSTQQTTQLQEALGQGFM